MNLDGQSLFNLVAGSTLTIIGWVASQVWSAVKELQRDLHDLEITLPQDYVR